MIASLLATGPVPSSPFLTAVAPLPLSFATAADVEVFALNSELRIWTRDGKRATIELTPLSYAGIRGSLGRRMVLKNLATGIVLAASKSPKVPAPKRALLDETLRRGVCGPTAPWPRELGVPADVLQGEILRAELSVRGQTGNHPGIWSLQIRCAS